MANNPKSAPQDKEPAGAAAAKTAAKKEASAPAATPAAAAAPAAPAAPGAESAATAASERTARVKAARTVSVGIAHINATFNNTQVSITDPKGQVLAWSSAGRMGFKGTRKSTAYAATIVAQEVARMVAPHRMQEIEVRVQGPGTGRESAIRALQSSGLTITAIRDVTPMPHDGCRPRKRRRV
ncbi:MAG: 30S ribosomal protein S11 [Lentisphaerae bacterium]|nr:30S ribosomal protein S11 [Lentisphaerota bacterium]